jgi:hypothetical protein
LRTTQPGRDLGGDRNTAARKADHDRPIELELFHGHRQELAGVSSISKPHGDLHPSALHSPCRAPAACFLLFGSA